MELIKVYNYRFEIISTVSKSFAFKAKGPEYEPIYNFSQDFLNTFAQTDENGERKLELIQESNGIFKGKFSDFVEKYKGLFPELQTARAQIQLIPDGKYFCIAPNIEFESEKSLEIRNILHSKNEGVDLEELKKDSQKTLGPLIEAYRLKAYGAHRLRIGEHVREKRVCRFCNKGMPEVFFKKKAHAISESLGNKLLVLNEECDTCNEKFAVYIEEDIVQYLSVFRSVYGIKAKGGLKALKGKNFTLTNVPEIVLTMKEAVRSKKLILPYKIKLDFDRKTTLQNIYKCFCKYFISLIKTEDLPAFTETIKWINGKLKTEKLPVIAEIVDYTFFTKTPELITFIRKNNDEKLPYAFGEFRFTCKRFVFIIPFSNAMEADFTLKKNYDHFWNSLPHYKAIKGVSFNDFSSDIAKDLVLKLNGTLKKRNQPT